MKVTKQQLRRLAALEAKFKARSVRGLLPLKSATALSDAYHVSRSLKTCSAAASRLTWKRKSAKIA